MAKTGRNDPCPCGSGKKYKNCCLAKDEQQDKERRARLLEEPAERPSRLDDDLEEIPPYLGDLFEDEDEEYESEEAAALRRRFGQAGYEGMIAIFQEMLEAKKLESTLAFDMLADIRFEAKERGELGRFAELVDRLQREAPDLYREEWPFYLESQLEGALARGETDRIPSLLEPFGREPDRDVEQFLWIADLLMYHGQTQPLLKTMLKAWPALGSSADLHPELKNYIANTIIQLIQFDHLDRGGAPDVEDPDLQKALSPFALSNPEQLAEGLAALSGQDIPSWTVGDFQPRGGRQDRVGRAAFVLLQQWLGYLRRRHGVPFGRGQLARNALGGYLAKQIREGKSGLPVLVPRSTSLKEYVESYFDIEASDTFKAASLVELLPLYLRFLQETGLLGEKEARRALEGLRKVATRTSELLREGHDWDMAKAIDRAWQ